MQLRVSKHVVVLFVLTAVMASILIFVGCEKQAKTGAQGVQTTPKTSIAGTAKTSAPADANAPAKPKACKAPKAKKACPAKSTKKSGAKKVTKSVVDANTPARQHKAVK
jgi:hypothetical protein